MGITQNIELLNIESGQKNVKTVYNENNAILASLVQAFAIDKDLTVPPGGESEGDAYIVATGATGAWLGQDNSIAVFHNSVWIFRVPNEGWMTFVQDEDKYYAYDGAAWSLFSNFSGGAVSFIEDGDGDTSFQTEKTANDNTARVDAGGAEVTTWTASQIDVGSTITSFNFGVASAINIGVAGDIDFDLSAGRHFDVSINSANVLRVTASRHRFTGDEFVFGGASLTGVGEYGRFRPALLHNLFFHQGGYTLGSGLGILAMNDITGAIPLEIKGNPVVVTADGASDSDLTVLGSEGNAAILNLWADDGDDDADKWRIIAQVANPLDIQTYSTGSWVSAMTIGAGANIGLGGAPNASALLDMQSTTQGFGLPVMTTAQINAINPLREGLQVWDSDIKKAKIYNGTAWRIQLDGSPF